MPTARTTCSALPTLLLLIASPAAADVIAYTDVVEWENAVLAQTNGHFHAQDFEGAPAGPLSSGVNDFHPFYVTISGAPGLNAIDDDPGAPLSPNGSTYLLGDPLADMHLSIIDYPPMFQPIGLGAHWVLSGDLSLEVQGTMIPVSDLLPSGSGFLGFVTDQQENEIVINVSGDAFGIDDIRTGNVPGPGSMWVAGASILGLVGRRRRR